MTRYLILAPRDRGTTPNLLDLIGRPACLVAGEIRARDGEGRGLDSLPRDPTCLYVDAERGDVYRADPSGLVYKGDLLAILGFADLSLALEGTTYIPVSIQTSHRLGIARFLAEAIGCKDTIILSTLQAGGALELTRRNLVGLLINLLGLASDQASDAVKRGKDPADCTLAGLIAGLHHAPQALCA